MFSIGYLVYQGTQQIMGSPKGAAQSSSELHLPFNNVVQPSQRMGIDQCLRMLIDSQLLDQQPMKGTELCVPAIEKKFLLSNRM